MRSFAYLRAESFPAASAALETPESLPKAAGTDLLDLLKERVVEPAALVDLSRIERAQSDPGVLSALATLAELAEDEGIRRDFPALHAAARQAATPQIRNRGTLGGNLCQVSRCPYLRRAGASCFKRDGSPCGALLPGGFDRTHAIFDVGPCACAHPSSLAPALIALGARVRLVRGEERRVLALEELYAPPAPGRLGDVALRPGELVEAVLLEASPRSRNSVYLEMRERESFDFALVSVAAAVELREGRVRSVRVACGAVAPRPRRMREVEAALRGRPLDAESIAGAADAARVAARPLRSNGFKATILHRLCVRALEELRQ
ncbi:MAG: xanthine dehydrogenase family protein subunit M [Planctomycetota bacterium]|nr:MAG: xanthine dehydrogenase family protein subunit M [Planctomycetota bacterium]